MPVDMRLYPRDWRQFTERIRARAGNRCEKCGAVNKEPHPITGGMVTLTTAHLDYTGGPCSCLRETGMKCCIEEHVLSLCNSCHNKQDAPARKVNARATRMGRKAAGVLPGMGDL